jgi:integrase
LRGNDRQIGLIDSYFVSGHRIRDVRLSEFPELDGRQVWLSTEEFDTFAGEAHSTKAELAFLLGGRSGLRRSEIVSVTYGDFEHADEGFVRVQESKTGYREAPVPDRVRYSISALSDRHASGDRVVDVTGKTVERWVKRSAGEMESKTGDEGWSFLRPHDLRRTWASWCIYERGVVPAVVFAWGGWSDWKTFKDHYLGVLSPEAARRERNRAYGSLEPDREVQELYQGTV